MDYNAIDLLLNRVLLLISLKKNISNHGISKKYQVKRNKRHIKGTLNESLMCFFIP